MKKRTVFVFCIFLIFGFGLYAQDKRIFTAEDMWQIKRVGKHEVSPDGRQIVFPLTTFNIAENKGQTNLFLTDLNGTAPRQLTYGNSDGNPVWSPDGRHIAFTSRRNSPTPQLFILPVHGGEARQITDLPVGVTQPKWFPDNQRVAFVASVLPHFLGDFAALGNTLKLRRESKVTAIVTENRLYKYWDRWLTDSLYPRIFTTHIHSKEIVDLMPGSHMFFAMMGSPEYDISPDGALIALSANSTTPPYDNLNYDIYLLPTNGSGSLQNITSDNPANDLNPVFSNDGRFIIYGMQKISHFYADKVRMVKYDLNTATHQNLTEDIDLSFGGWVIDRQNRSIYAHAEVEGGQYIFSLNTNGSGLRKIYGSGTNNNVALAADNRLVFSHKNLNRPSEIYRIPVTGGTAVPTTSLNETFMQQFEFGVVEDIRYKGADNADVQLYIIYPPNFDPSKKYPMVMMIHGGPHGVFGNDFHFRWNAHLFAAPGYVVVMPNFHGSTGFGQDFAISIHGQHADLPYKDVMQAFDFMAAKPFIDSTRVAAAGGSYGGYLVSWMAGKTNRFAALVNHAGVFDLMQQFGSDITSSRDVAYGGSPWENKDNMLTWSPAMYAENFSSPMLIIHGQKDYRVPVNHAYTVYGIYKGKGLDARLVYFPDENHWILTPQNSIFWYQELHNWFERYLK